MSWLKRISADRLERVCDAQRTVPLEELMDRCYERDLNGGHRDLVTARLQGWAGPGHAIIAEYKRRSPSRGPLRPGSSARDVALAYERGGAFGISVLTEPDHFGGCMHDLSTVAEVAMIPVLCKDFVIDPYQLWEAKAAGADMVLLIVRLLGNSIREYVQLAEAVGIEPLVEVHDLSELDTAIDAGARLVGINNRNLDDLEVDLKVCRSLLPTVPAGVLAVAESGLRSPADVAEMAALGADAFLVGENLVTSPDPEVELARLSGRRGQG